MQKVKAKAPKKAGASWELRLYVANATPRSKLAQENLLAFCKRYLPGRYRLTIIDIVKQPASALRDEIVATPTLIRTLPGPPKRLIGTLADSQRVLSALGDGNGAWQAAS